MRKFILSCAFVVAIGLSFLATPLHVIISSLADGLSAHEGDGKEFSS